MFDTDMENNFNVQENRKNDVDSGLNKCQMLKSYLEANIASWPMFITCNSSLALHFPSNNFGDPVNSLLPPSVSYCMIAP